MRVKRRHRRVADAAGPNKIKNEEKVKVAEPVNPMSSFKPLKRLIRQVVSSPNFSSQFLAILMTLTADDFNMNRRIDSMSSSLDTLRNITNVVNNTMNSLKSAAEAPRQIRRLVNPKDSQN
ncbi:MAG TPA: hypothetical protein PKA10_10605 [Selenomonadales bacterium]|nr:hypothetical protein [Selenomonadales bacterium]